MKNQQIKDMLQFLPETTIVVKTPDLNIQAQRIVEVETVELKTRDVIEAFMNLQQMAITTASEIENAQKRREAIDRIKRMVYFDGVGVKAPWKAEYGP